MRDLPTDKTAQNPSPAAPLAHSGSGEAGEAEAAKIQQALIPRLENKALHYLGRYPSSAANLRQVLRRFVNRKVMRSHKFADYKARQDDSAAWEALVMAAIDTLISRYSDLGYVNDEDYAKNRIRLLRARGNSQRHITAYLLSKGVSLPLIKQALASSNAELSPHIEADDGENHENVIELAAARRYAARRRLGCYATATGRRKPDWERRHLASMLRAGFGYAVAKEALAEKPDGNNEE